MNRQNQQKVPEPGCMGMGCLTVVVSLMLMPCLLFAAVLAENRKADTPQWGALLFLAAYPVAYAVAYFYFWPHLYQMFFQPGESEHPSSGPSSSEGSLLVSYQSESRPRKRKSDDEFPWEVFAYGYLMHELLDDDSGGESEDSGWGGDDHDADDLGTEDFDGGEEFWFYEDF